MSEVITLSDTDDDLDFVITDVKSLAEDEPVLKCEGKGVQTGHDKEKPVKQRACEGKGVQTGHDKEKPVKQRACEGKGVQTDHDKEKPVKQRACEGKGVQTDHDKEKPVKQSASEQIFAAHVNQKEVVSPKTCLHEDNIKNNVQSCLDRWKEVFPWVTYKLDGHRFICEVCLWAYDLGPSSEVYRIESIPDIHKVAAKLRGHSFQKLHSGALREQTLMFGLLESLLSLVKDDIFRDNGFDSVLKKVFSFIDAGLYAGNSPLFEFSNSKKISKAERLLHVMLQNLAVAIEDWHLQSLKQSPYFSVVTFMSSDYAIVRWLTSTNEIVEHIFCSHIHKSQKRLPVLAHLQFKGVKMARMVCLSQIGMPQEKIIKSFTKLVNVANRCCPMDTLLKWLSYSKSLQELIRHLDAVAKLCAKLGPAHSIGQACGFTEGGEAYKCLKFYGSLSAALSLDKLLKDHDDLEGISELDFEKLNSKKKSLSIQIAFLLPKLDSVVSLYDSLRFQYEVERFKEKMERFKKDSTATKQDLALISLVDLYFSHLIVTNFSQANECPVIEILSKNMSIVRYDEFEKVFTSTMMKGLCGGKGFQQFIVLHRLFGRDRQASPLLLLNKLQQHSEYSLKFPELLSLGQMIMVFPMLSAHSERYTFDIAAAEAFLTEKVPPDLVQLLSYINLEGPKGIESLNREILLKLSKGYVARPC